MHISLMLITAGGAHSCQCASKGKQQE